MGVGVGEGEGEERKEEGAREGRGDREKEKDTHSLVSSWVLHPGERSAPGKIQSESPVGTLPWVGFPLPLAWGRGPPQTY